jgi:hypothetical protein
MRFGTFDRVGSMSDLPTGVIEAGRGIAVWDVTLPSKPAVGVAMGDSLPDDAATFETVRVYRNVTVEDYAGELRAVATAPPGVDADRVPIDPKYVRLSVAGNPKRAERFGVYTPAESIDYDDLPEEYK